jgi:Sulfotransferase domain
MPLPDFLVIGPPKAGTTALHSALAAHPQLYMSGIKEPRFFLCDGRPPPSHGGPGDAQTYQEYVWKRADYEALFAAAPTGTRRGESSPFYLSDLDAHRRMRQLVPEAKLIAVFRDPVERAHSNWAHLWSAGLEPYADFIQACQREPERVAEGWAPFWQYTGLGRYGEQLEHLYGFFPREQILLLRYRDLRNAPADSLDRICRFLGVDEGLVSEIPAENVRRHVQPTPRAQALQAVLRSGASVGYRFPLTVRKAAREPLLALLQLHGGRRPKITKAQRRRMLGYFSDDVHRLEQVTGESYADWLSVVHNTDAAAEAIAG